MNMMNKIWHHPGQEQMQVEVILASRGANGAPPIYTLRLRYPRIIHAEAETHRIMSIHGTVVEVYEPGLGIMSDQDLSRNARSSRAVPVKTMLNEVRNTPFIPWHWGKNQKGMQAGEECNEPVLIPDWDDVNFHGKPHVRQYNREEAWLQARDKAVDVATAMMNAGYHKQIVNRLLEPFSWIDAIITSTEWANFLWLRDHGDAEPHLQDLARLVKQAIDGAEVQVLEEGQWHLPYVNQSDYLHMAQLVNTGAMPQGQNATSMALKLSAARCARISYAPFDGDASYERELQRYEQLMGSDRLHASPVEHQAQVDELTYVYGDKPEERTYAFEDLRGNFAPGWIQNRQTIPGQFIPG